MVYYEWTERQPAGAVNKAWRSCASDSDGTNLIAGVNEGRLYTSSNSGVNWTERQPAGAVNKYWRCCSSDSDGTNLIAGVYTGRLYTSSNSGVDWTERQPAGAVNKYWRCCSSDSDGTNLIAGVNEGRLYTSSNSGVNWTERQPAGAVDKYYICCASDSDGTNLIIVVASIAGGSTTKIYTSSNSGVDWTERQPSGVDDVYWSGCASDSDGTNLIATSNSRLYTSSNSGVDWTERQVGGHCCASDSDGTNLIAAAYNGRLYTSSNSGVNWIERQPAGAVNKAWRCCSSDSDGTNLIAGVDGGRLYTGALGGGETNTYTTATIIRNQMSNINPHLNDYGISAIINQAEGVVDGIMKRTGRIATVDFTFDADKHGLIRLATTMLSCFMVMSSDTEEYTANSYASLTADLYWQLWELCSDLLANGRVVDYLKGLDGSASTPKYTEAYIVREQIIITIDKTDDEIETIINQAEGVIDGIMKRTGRIATVDFTFDADKHGLIRLATTMLSCFIIVSSNTEMYVSTSHAALTADLYWKSFTDCIRDLADAMVVDYLKGL